MFELFHDIAQAESARVRRFIVEHGHKDHVSFRNVSYEEVRADFLARGGTTTPARTPRTPARTPRTPALWDGERLHTGEEEIFVRLTAGLSFGWQAGRKEYE